jgi:hypothetical protein
MKHIVYALDKIQTYLILNGRYTYGTKLKNVTEPKSASLGHMNFLGFMLRES